MTKTRLILAAAAVLLVTILAAAYFNDHESCLRTNGTRSGLQIFFTGQAVRAGERAQTQNGVLRVLDLESQRSSQTAAAHEQPLACSTLLPGAR